MVYTVQVTVKRTVEKRGVEWDFTFYTPQFMLDGNVLGVTHDGAAEYIAAKMFVDLGIPREDIEVHILRREENLVAI